MQSKNYLKNITVILIILLITISGTNCMSNYKKAKKLLPDSDKKFLESVQYLITKKEKNIFVHLDAKNRKAFIKDFWKKRDPTPETEENEYKDTYYRRIKEANSLFISAGKNGWLTDRGRTYILFGPPERRDRYPMGYSFYEPPVEVWYYGMFPIVFVDKYRDGDYKITYSSYIYLQQITKAEMILHPKYRVWDKKLSGNIKVKSYSNGNKYIKASIPYRVIVFHKHEDIFRGILVLNIKFFKNKKLVKSINKEIKINLKEEELKKLPENFNIEEPINVKTNGEYIIKLKVSDKTTGKGVSKKFVIKI